MSLLELDFMFNDNVYYTKEYVLRLLQKKKIILICHMILTMIIGQMVLNANYVLILNFLSHNMKVNPI